jgi:hypothetical protein
MALVGWNDFEHLQSAFGARSEVVRSMAGRIRSVTDALGAAKEEVARLQIERRAAIDDVWEGYRTTFEGAFDTTRYGDT